MKKNYKEDISKEKMNNKENNKLVIKATDFKIEEISEMPMALRQQSWYNR
ncbi:MULTISPECIES: hypothetical protein [Bacillus]|nr:MULTISPECIES: hypothetical protein [Bacillus]AKD31719.1 hypothetical protein AW02_035710 [Bacillus velezensis NJN-6]MBB4874736.1 hypothetical protein [Bacillus velezensis]MBE1281316.1 hypothetical protein [Bacillus sp. Bvel1]MBW8601975.1 hypothetical protein [Bacillus amyloliquefaciens]MCT6681046.1 hypothetical protein [Bacillus velezensis]